MCRAEWRSSPPPPDCGYLPATRASWTEWPGVEELPRTRRIWLLRGLTSVCGDADRHARWLCSPDSAPLLRQGAVPVHEQPRHHQRERRDADHDVKHHDGVEERR